MNGKEKLRSTTEKDSTIRHQPEKGTRRTSSEGFTPVGELSNSGEQDSKKNVFTLKEIL